jgi:flagellar hook-associated protein 3 FlgL
LTYISSSMPIVVTPSDLSTSMIEGLTTDQNSKASLEEQFSTGNAITVASDTPSGAASILQLQGSVTRANQYAANAADGVGWLTLGNSTASSVLGVLQSLQSTLEGLSGSTLTSDPSTVAATSAQVSRALSQLVDLANTTEEGGQPIFAGTGNATMAYAVTTDTATGAPVATYVGNATAPTRTVAPGTKVPVAVTGPELFGAETVTSGGTTTTNPSALLSADGVLNQTIADLQRLGTAVSTGTGVSAALANVVGPARTTTSLAGAANTSSDLSNLSAALNQAETAAGVLGASQDSVQNFSTQATSSLASIQTELSSVQDTNMAQAITNLQAQQTAYQSALYATSQLSQDSLVKYL